MPTMEELSSRGLSARSQGFQGFHLDHLLSLAFASWKFGIRILLVTAMALSVPRQAMPPRVIMPMRAERPTDGLRRIALQYDHKAAGLYYLILFYSSYVNLREFWMCKERVVNCRGVFVCVSLFFIGSGSSIQVFCQCPADCLQSDAYIRLQDYKRGVYAHSLFVESSGLHLCDLRE